MRTWNATNLVIRCTGQMKGILNGSRFEYSILCVHFLTFYMVTSWSKGPFTQAG